MQLTLGRVHWGWCVFPLHNQSLTQTFTNHRFLSNLNTRWRLLNFIIIILWLNPKPFIFPITPLRRLTLKSASLTSPRDNVIRFNFNSVGILGHVYIVSHSYQTSFSFSRSNFNLDCGLYDHMIMRFALYTFSIFFLFLSYSLFFPFFPLFLFFLPLRCEFWGLFIGKYRRFWESWFGKIKPVDL
jgi:hypothetical protein